MQNSSFLSVLVHFFVFFFLVNSGIFLVKFPLVVYFVIYFSMASSAYLKMHIVTYKLSLLRKSWHSILHFPST